MISNRQQQIKQIEHHAQTLQRRATAMTALFMTILLLCIEHVRAFANQYHISAHDAMVLASAASSLTRKLGATLPKKTTTASFLTPLGRSSGNNSNSDGSGRRSTTQLNAWSIPAIAMPSMPAMPTRKELGINTLGSWYSEVDPTTKPVVYDDEYDNSYSFSSPTDDWPSMSTADADESNSAVRSHMRRGPLRTIRSVAGRFKDIIVQ
mmetsp:Transcript_27/g.42  ORF Transcript_27/g.42 Transcript_27/m.42 type:complete len:208 (+) Transcript_27:454-1077(+)